MVWIASFILSSIANDPCGDLNPKLTWEVSALATMQLADRCFRQGIGHFIYASSGSVYGLKDEEQVVEELSAEPLSEYNKTKMVAERVVLSYADRMSIADCSACYSLWDVATNAP